ncbi:relaxin receptor 1-like [Centruroides sculpturatus]|uniref:relaxin receptor 1-like n=1 Tax=Centruroides sculpturatus TaxID=218467 RepID=UPI000C6CEE9F|nr:relaxin receptor 1-like [Centruroides sculpturatus]
MWMSYISWPILWILTTASLYCSAQDHAKEFICEAEKFPCGNSSICLDRVYHCDGIVHCEHGEDEENCDDIHGSLASILKDLNKTPMVNVVYLSSYRNCTISPVPAGCNCRQFTWLSCTNLHLKNIPNNLSSNITKLVLSNNSIETLERGSFQNYRNLKILHLGGNLIRKIENGTFIGLYKLKFLLLMRNDIQEISRGMFQHLDNVDWLDLKKNKLKKMDVRILHDLPSLRVFDLSYNYLTMKETEFPRHRNLYWLDLRSNEISKVKSHTFSWLINLEYLSLKDNKIDDIDETAFQRLIKLTELNLSFNQLKFLRPKLFYSLRNLSKLKLEYNPLTSLPVEIFHHLINLKSLNLSGIEIENINIHHFKSLKNLEFIYFRKFLYCSYAPYVRNCMPKTDGLSSIDHLLVWPMLRFSVWIVALTTCMGNTIVLTWRVLSRKEDHVLSLFIKNLAVADFLMGIYLLAIGAQDLAFRNKYNRHAHAWMSSWQCTICGILAMISCEVSVLILSLITVERYRCIRSNVRVVSITAARYSLIIIWVFGILLALFPMFHWQKGQDFYSTNGLCFPLHIDDPYMLGWQYSAFVFLGINFTAVILIIILYLRMFLIIKDDRQRARPVMIKKHEDIVLAMRFFFIVLTDCLCWIPIVVIKVIALNQITISDSLYACVVVFILPINSALNPVIYTMAAPTELRRKLYKWFERASACLNRLEYLIVSESKTSTSSQMTQSLTTTERRSSSSGSILQAAGIHSPIADCQVEETPANQNPPLAKQGFETML